jgi:hypothetical protein
MFVHEYVDHWRKFVAGFKVATTRVRQTRGSGLDIPASYNSPLLALFAMTANDLLEYGWQAGRPADCDERAIVGKVISSYGVPEKRPV